MCFCCLRTHWHRFLSRGFRYWPGPTVALEARCGALFLLDVFLIPLALFSSQRGGRGRASWLDLRRKKNKNKKKSPEKKKKNRREIAEGRGQFLGISLGGRECKDLRGHGGSSQDKAL